MKIGIITGSGFYDFPALETASIKKISTKFGEVELQTSKRNGHDLFFMTRHGAGHRRLPNAINYRANILALKECGVDLIVATSVMGIIDNKLPLAQLMLFNDLFFWTTGFPEEKHVPSTKWTMIRIGAIISLTGPSPLRDLTAREVPQKKPAYHTLTISFMAIQVDRVSIRKLKSPF